MKANGNLKTHIGENHNVFTVPSNISSHTAVNVEVDHEASFQEKFVDDNEHE